MKDKAAKTLRVAGHKLHIMSYDWEGTNFDNPDEVRAYLSDNMSEGYLAQEEDAFITELMSRYQELLNKEDKMSELINTIQTNKVV